MKSVLVLISPFLLAAAVRGSTLLESRTQGDYVLNPSGNASLHLTPAAELLVSLTRCASRAHTLSVASL